MRGTNVVLRGGRVIDGTGAPARRVDVALRDGAIAGFDAAAAGAAAEVIDVEGLVIAPGFIDVHTHDDRLLLADPAMTPKLSQGVTTVVTGNCGVSLAPLGDRAAVPPLNLVAADAASAPSATISRRSRRSRPRSTAPPSSATPRCAWRR
jgi:N-acyl-D-amino-acid deacylase